MLKRLGVMGAMIAVAALAVSSVGPATGQLGADRHGDDRDKVRVLSTLTEEAFIDVGEADFSLGDTYVFSSKLTKHRKRVGHTGVVCTVTSTKRAEFQCVATAKLRRGQITVQGLVAGEPEVFKFAITGGTGRYEGAEGTLVVRQLSETRERLTFHLTD
jgi:hypothetical protein